ncbi:YbhB/YbcL family Raf kinase inhibitor-like protein [Coralloluteibacterium thermophilus]|uniref:YbhB/YbcL family Raf kinase inhibitor-like protein n=1 Tax=Coralloluteibacterium thermophilum TaxID=2707049 RepID=A0ABV9NL32_9GAMM
MLENLPRTLGHVLRDVRPGLEAIVLNGEATADATSTIEVASTAFAHGDPIPVRFTADGPGHSPPLRWNGVPEEAAAVVLLVEDADSITPQPLVHAVVWNLPGEDGSLPEGALDADAEPPAAVGRNSYFAHAWLPPDPPPGHGIHRYVFQVFALREAPPIERSDDAPGRSRLLEVLPGNVIACGGMIGTYERGSDTPALVGGGTALA